MAEAVRHSGGRGRLPTRVPGLDEVLHGGFLRGTTNLVLGPPGSGKTVLAAQMAFAHVGNEGRAIYLTLLSEPQGQLLDHLSRLAFFDAGAVGERLYFVNGYGDLAEGGTDALLALLRRLVRDHKADLLVLDGLPVIQTLSESSAAFQRFLHEVHALATVTGCTMLLLAATEDGTPGPEAAQFDALVHLHDEILGRTAERSLHVAKLRGSPSLRGRHVFRIDDEGIRVFPRLESRVRAPAPEPEAEAGRAALGVQGLDEMLGGGLRRATGTLVYGRAGTGKTSLCLSFLGEGARRGETGFYLSVGEPPSGPLVERLGPGVERMVQPPVEIDLDQLGRRILEALRRTGARRFVLDGIAALGLAIPRRERIEPFLAALCAHLHGSGVTTIMTLERGHAEDYLRGTAGLFQNILRLDLTERAGRLHRRLAIIETADTPAATEIRELFLDGSGLRMGPPIVGDGSGGDGGSGDVGKGSGR